MGTIRGIDFKGEATLAAAAAASNCIQIQYKVEHQ